MTLFAPATRSAFLSWQEEMGEYAELAMRACGAWRNNEDFLAVHKPDVLPTSR